MAQTIVATVRCCYCHWAAHMSGDTALEVGAFLRARLLEHVAAMHADQPPPPLTGTEQP